MSGESSSPEASVPAEKSPADRFFEHCEKIRPNTPEAQAASVYLQTMLVEEQIGLEARKLGNIKKAPIPDASILTQQEVAISTLQQIQVALVLKHTEERVDPAYASAHQEMDNAYREFKTGVNILDPANQANHLFEQAIAESHT